LAVLTSLNADGRHAAPVRAPSHPLSDLREAFATFHTSVDPHIVAAARRIEFLPAPRI